MQVQQGDMSPLRGSTSFRCSLSLFFLMSRNFNEVVTHTDTSAHESSECDRPERCTELDVPH